MRLTQATVTTLYHEYHYFPGVRMLTYQLLHTATQTSSSIPVIVLVTTDVPQSNRDRLTKDGATIIEVTPINFKWEGALNARHGQAPFLRAGAIRKNPPS